MKYALMSGVALATATALSLPSTAYASSPSVSEASARLTVNWIDGNRLNDGGRAFLEVLRHSELDGFARGPLIAAEVDAMIGARQAEAANRMLSQSWVDYVQTLDRRAPGMDYADPTAAPKAHSAQQILSAAASTPSLAGHVAKISSVNPVYANLRQAAIDSGRARDPNVIADLARLRTVPTSERYIIVDAASANLWMVENGQIAGSMRVITGDSKNATPMIASVIREATFNPYWNVPSDFARETLAPRIIEQGISYLEERQYEVFASELIDAPKIDPTSVDWAGVAAGTVTVRLRRAPGEWNSMGKVKFGFANDHDIYLHDTPDKSLFANADRNLSHGCIRLSDASRLAEWLFGRPVQADGTVAEQKVRLPQAVPIYITRTASITVDGATFALADGRSPKSVGKGGRDVGR